MDTYIHPLLDVIAQHSAWAGPLLFLASFGESLAFVSLVFPGTAILLAAGALIPSQVIPLWPVLLCSIAGATLGDSVSYWVGKRFGWAVCRRWPFTRHPEWLERGIAFFAHHGGKSVFIGRFFGPIRAVIPLAAGVMRMPTGRFWIANVASAMVWGPGVLVPGALIGIAAETLAIRSLLPIGMAALLVFGVVGLWIVSRRLTKA